MRARSRRPAASCASPAAASKDEIDIIVEDDGPGVEPDAMDKVFERFYTDRPDHGFGQNSGLGLSISKQIVEAHDGRIWVENRLGEPAAPGEAPAGARRALHRAPAGDLMPPATGTRPIMTADDPAATVHASAVLTGARALLIRGPSAAGKSLARARAAAGGAIRAAAVRPAGRRRPRASRGASRPPAGAPGRRARGPDRGPRPRHPARRP